MSDHVESLPPDASGDLTFPRRGGISFGVAVDSAALGSLPTIDNNRQWLRDAQRFPVLVDFELDGAQARSALRVGSQVSVIVYTGNHGLFNLLGRIYIRLASILSYAF